jgi:hypothetical protein
MAVEISRIFTLTLDVVTTDFKRAKLDQKKQNLIKTSQDISRISM